MIHLFVGSHVKKPEFGLFSDWIRNNMNDLHCCDWPKPVDINCVMTQFAMKLNVNCYIASKTGIN